MHASVMQWVESVRPIVAPEPSTIVVEVGSFDVNGSTRSLFPNTRWTGLDIRPGRGVDQVIDPRSAWGEKYKADLVISTETLEHDRNPFWTVRQMATACWPGGYVLITCRGFDERGCFPVHDHPDDLWRFTPRGVRAILEDVGLSVLYCGPDPEAHGVFALAQLR